MEISRIYTLFRYFVVTWIFIVIAAQSTSLHAGFTEDANYTKVDRFYDIMQETDFTSKTATVSSIVECAIVCISASCVAFQYASQISDQTFTLQGYCEYGFKRTNDGVNYDVPFGYTGYVKN